MRLLHTGDQELAELIETVLEYQAVVSVCHQTKGRSDLEETDQMQLCCIIVSGWGRHLPRRRSVHG